MSDSAVPDHPERVGPYRIVRLIGEGGMGCVYEAEQKEPIRRVVALKMMKPGLDTREVVGRFEAERQTLAVMSHPGIAKVIDGGAAESGRPYFVMELVRGVRIDEYADRQRLTVRKRIELLLRVCDAIQHAHQKGVIHRDLKPGNVLVTEESGRAAPKVIDFGVAKATGMSMSDRTVVTQFGHAMGTLTYMSPEQAEMTGLDVDTRSDIYALGVMLYALAIGKPPLDPKVLGVPAFLTQLLQPDVAIPTALSRLKAMDPADASFAARCRNTDVQRLAREVGGDLQWILLKALEKDRNRRYESVSGLSADLSRYLTDEPISARRPTASYRFGKFVRRNRVAVVAAAAAALGLIGGTAAATIGMLQANASEERARQEAATAEEVSGFLVGLFRVSDPLEARGNTVTAREILDAGSARIRTELNDQPAVQTRLMATMASVYDGLGLFGVAAELIEEVIRAQRTADAPDVEIATSLFRLASIRAQQGRLREAEQHQRAALAARVSATGPTDLEVARSQHDLARILARLGRGDTAVVLLRAALDTRRALLGPEHADLVAGHADLSEVLLMAGRPAEAVEAAESALTLATRLYGQDDRIGDVADAYSRLAAAHYGGRDLVAAERAEREALRRRTALFDDGHPNVLIVELNLGIILYEQGRFDESEALIREVSQAVLDRLPPNHAYVETAQVYLALNLASLDRHVEASAVAEKAFGLVSGNPDQNMPRVMGTVRVSDLALYASLAAGRSLAGLGRVDEARAYLERTRDGLEGRQGAPGQAAAAARSALLSLDGTARPAGRGRQTPSQRSSPPELTLSRSARHPHGPYSPFP